jgi:acetyl-CoA carboxylase biotin carboxyl carrier protein
MKKEQNKETVKKEKLREPKKNRKIREKPDFDTILKTARTMAEIVKEQELSEFSLEYAGAKIKMFRDDEQPCHAVPSVPAMHFAAPQQTFAPQASPQAAPAVSVSSAVSEEGSDPANLVLSPMAGTFYRAPSPDSAPFVEVNQQVSKGQVLCILEAMKLMNEFKAEKSGVVKKIFKENAEPVAEGDKLFVIE